MNPQIEHARQAALGARDRLLKTFAAVPEDKLGWSPAPSGRPALRIAAHCAVSYGAFARMLRGEPMPATSMEDVRRYSEAEMDKLTTRAAVVAAIQSGSEQVDVALAELPEERLGTTIKLPMGDLPMGFIMSLPAIHAHGHASQIDYLETLWGDMQMHM